MAIIAQIGNTGSFTFHSVSVETQNPQSAVVNTQD